MNNRLEQIRESERKSHIEMYSNEELYHSESWLKKPIKTVRDLIPMFSGYSMLNVLDIGCGVGRNCLAIANEYKHIDCNIDCVDILDLAIEKLYVYAEEHGVSKCINGIVKPIEEFTVLYDHYDLIIAVSALEHIDSMPSFVNKLNEIKSGIRNGGIVCLVMNSEIEEFNKATGEEIPAQFEVNISTKEMQNILSQIFVGWNVLKSTVQSQQYDIPRENIISDLRTNVVTFVAQKEK